MTTIISDSKTGMVLEINVSYHEVRLWNWRGYGTYKKWRYRDTANLLRFWAPNDVSGAILKGMAAFEHHRQSINAKDAAFREEVQSITELAKDFREIYETTLLEND